MAGMLRRGLAAGALTVTGLCASAALPAVLAGTAAGAGVGWAALVGWVALFVFLGCAVGLFSRDDHRTWAAAGILATGWLVIAAAGHTRGLPGRPPVSWDAPAVAGVVGGVLVLVLWLLPPRVPHRLVAVAAGGLLTAVLLPLGAGPLPENATVPAAALFAGHHHHAAAAPVADPSTGPAVPLEEQLDQARAAAEQWPTLARARAGGWTQADDYIAGIGSHWMRFDRIDSTFDPAAPEMLLFAGNDPDSPIVGVTYYVVNTQPSGFTGDADVWHQHPGFCIGEQGPLFAGDGRGQCKASADWSWMLHAWVVPGWQDPDGVFALENPRV